MGVWGSSWGAGRGSGVWTQLEDGAGEVGGAAPRRGFNGRAPLGGWGGAGEAQLELPGWGGSLGREVFVGHCWGEVVGGESGGCI